MTTRNPATPHPLRLEEHQGGIQRLELYLDDTAKPFQTLEHPPFRVHLDTRLLPDGQHVLRLVRVQLDGTHEEKRVPFTVDNLPDLAIHGLEDGVPLRGEVNLEIQGGAMPPPRHTGVPPILYAAVALVLLFTVWGFFSLSPRAELVLQRLEPAPTASSGAVIPNTAKLGEEVYTLNCASCHKADGKGVPAAIPFLAGNPSLKDPNGVLATVIKGASGPLTVNGQTFNGVMPGFARLSDEEIAAVVSHIRTSWGNTFGKVTPAQVPAHR